MSLVASLIATKVYFASTASVDVVIDESVAWTIVVSLCFAWMCVFGAFLLLMKREFVMTFFSTQTAVGWVHASFVNGDSDEQKTRVLRKNRRMWLSIRDDVKAWTLENWERWEEEKPEWFNDAFKASVDDGMIPADALVQMKMQGGGSRRRSSLGDVLGVRGESKRSTREVVPVQD